MSCISPYIVLPNPPPLTHLPSSQGNHPDIIKVEDTIDNTIEDVEIKVKTEVEQEVKVDVKEPTKL